MVHKPDLELNQGFPGDSDGKESACSVGDPGLIPGSRRSPGVQNSFPLQYYCLENSMDRGAWWAIVLHRVRYDWVTNRVKSRICILRKLLIYLHLLNREEFTFFLLVVSIKWNNVYKCWHRPQLTVLLTYYNL